MAVRSMVAWRSWLTILSRITVTGHKNDRRHLREETSDRKEALMATYHVSMIIDIPDGSDDEETEVEQAVRDLAAEHLWQVLSLTVLQT